MQNISFPRLKLFNGKAYIIMPPYEDFTGKDPE
jgi:hypothetical protein